MTPEFEPSKWWRAIDSNGDLLAETSTPSDFESLGLLDEPGISFQRLYEKKDYKWMEESPERRQP